MFITVTSAVKSIVSPVEKVSMKSIVSLFESIMKSIVSLLKSINEKYRHHCWKVSMKSIASLLKSINEKYRITVEKYQWKVSYHTVSLCTSASAKNKSIVSASSERAERCHTSRMSFLHYYMKIIIIFK